MDRESGSKAVVSEEQIRHLWCNGRHHLQSALQLVQSTAAPSSDEQRIIEALSRGDLSAGMKCGHAGMLGEEVSHHLEQAEEARVRMITVAKSMYATALEIYGNRNSSDGSDLISRTWFNAYKSAFQWRGDGTFKSWLFSIGHHALLDQGRRSNRLVTNTDPRIFDGAEFMPLNPGGTSTLGKESMLEAYLDALAPVQRHVWDEWCRAFPTTSSNESVYEDISTSTRQTASSVKSIIYRIQEDCQRLVGKELSSIIVLDIGILQVGNEQSVLATGVDVDDRRRLYLMRTLGKNRGRAFARALETLVSCGLANNRRILVVVSGDSQLQDTVDAVLGDRAEIQICLDHVEQQIVSVAEATAKRYKRSLARAIGLSCYETSCDRLYEICDELGMPRSQVRFWLTFKRLGFDRTLRGELCCTSFPAGVEAIFNKLRGHRSLPRRREKLTRLSLMLNDLDPTDE
jgi:DNA-directed RNA polymerase specialized sigma24 family protein